MTRILASNYECVTFGVEEEKELGEIDELYKFIYNKRQNSGYFHIESAY